MTTQVRFDPDLIKRYDLAGPRYTSYPTAVQFHEGFDAETYRRHVAISNDELIPAPLSLYVHLPYCTRRCPYCDFNTYAVRTIPEERYADALLREAAFAAGLPAWAGRRVSTVFFGGGTPSLFSPAAIGRVIEAVDRLWGLEGGAEVTLEANPGSLEGGGEQKLRGFRAAGVNRVSLGAQSFQQAHADEAPAMLQRLRQAVIDNQNVFAVLMDAVRVCSLGQITHALFEVGGQYRRNM